jgi:hypothetical protein
VVTLQARSCRTGEVLDQEQVQAAKKEDVLSALGQIASRFRKRVGESLTSIQEHNTPLAEATTPSLEALEAYSAGWKLHTSSIPTLLWRKQPWGVNTLILMSTICPLSTPPKPGSCGTTPATGRGSTSLPPTRGWLQETWKGAAER